MPQLGLSRQSLFLFIVTAAWVDGLGILLHEVTQAFTFPSIDTFHLQHSNHWRMGESKGTLW